VYKINSIRVGRPKEVEKTTPETPVIERMDKRRSDANRTMEDSNRSQEGGENPNGEKSRRSQTHHQPIRFTREWDENVTCGPALRPGPQIALKVQYTGKTV